MRARLRVQNLQCLVYAVVQPCDERTCPAPCDMSYCCVQKRDGLQSPGLLDISVTALLLLIKCQTTLDSEQGTRFSKSDAPQLSITLQEKHMNVVQTPHGRCIYVFIIGHWAGMN